MFKPHDNYYYPHFTDEEMEVQSTPQVRGKVGIQTQMFWFKYILNAVHKPSCIANVGLEGKKRTEGGTSHTDRKRPLVLAGEGWQVKSTYPGA